MRDYFKSVRGIISLLFPYVIIIIPSGLSAGSFLYALLLDKQVPTASLTPLLVLLTLGVVFAFLWLVLLIRFSQLVRRLSFQELLRTHCYSLLPLFLSWFYFLSTKLNGGGLVFHVASAEISHGLIYMILILAISLLIPTIAILKLRRIEAPQLNGSHAKIASLSLPIFGLLLLLAFFGPRLYDFALLRGMKQDFSRCSIGRIVRDSVAAPIPSKTVLSINQQDKSRLVSGFGIITPERAPSLAFHISIRDAAGKTLHILDGQTNGESLAGWKEVFFDLDSVKPFDITLSVGYQNPNFFLDSLKICRYYYRLLLDPKLRFDPYQRLAVWLSPTLISSRSDHDINVILIGIDTLRADHVSLYGYPRPTTPNIDNIGRQGIVFENCSSACPWTLPSFFSMMTSTYPWTHRYGTNVRGVGAALMNVSNFWTVGDICPDYSIKTLAEMLKEKGYTTAAFVNNPFLSREFEFDRGFSEFHSYAPTARQGVEAVNDWLTNHQNDSFFLFFHLMEPHLPMRDLLENGLATRFGNKESRSAIDDYDAKIRFGDDQLGRLLGRLKQLGLENDTLLVITADHGEEWRDHGKYGHGHSLYNELLQVPLIYFLPQRLAEPKQIHGCASTLDIAPTILQILDISTPKYYQGIGLLSSIETGTVPSRPLFAEALTFGNEKKGVISDGYKMIYTADTNALELYDMRHDPREKAYLQKADTAVEDGMKTLLESLLEKEHGICVELTSDEKFSGKLTTTGTFIKVMPMSLSKPDLFQIGEKAKEICFSLEPVPGRNAFIFSTDPPQAQVRLENINEGNSPPIFLGSSTKGVAPPLAFTKEDARVSPKRLGREKLGGVHIWLKDFNRTHKDLLIQDSTKKEMESLGYLN